MPAPLTCDAAASTKKYFTINACASGCVTGEAANLATEECNTAGVVCCESDGENITVHKMNTPTECWGGSASGHQPALTFKQAENQCKSWGSNKRLCTVQEIRSGVTCNSGCDMECAMVWTSDEGPCHETN